MEKSKTRKPAALLALGVVACAVCCSVPLLVGLGVGGTLLTAIGAYAEMLGAVFLGLGALGFGVAMARRRVRHGSTCAIDCACRDAAAPS